MPYPFPRTHRSLLTAALPLLAGAAYAESDVTLYGRIDLGIRYMENVTQADDGQRRLHMAEGSRGRWGLKGTEDIGNGYQVFFHLENRFRANTGQQDGSVFWRDKAWLGVSHKEYGSLRLGRMSSPVNEKGINGRFEAFGGDSLGGVGDRGAYQTQKWDSAVSYQSPSFGGFSFLGTVSLRPDTKDAYGLQAEYRYTPAWLVSTAWQRDTAAVENSGGQVDTWQTYSLATSYDLGPVILLGIYARSWDIGLSDAGSMNVYTAGARIPVTTGEIRATFQHLEQTRINGVDNARDIKRQRAGLGYHYPLSTRTSLNLSLLHDRYKRGPEGRRHATGAEVALRMAF